MGTLDSQSRSDVVPCHQVEARLPTQGPVGELDVHVEVGGDQGVRVHEGASRFSFPLLLSPLLPSFLTKR